MLRFSGDQFFHVHDGLTSCNSVVFERAHIKAWQNEEMEEAMAEATKREEEVCHTPFLCTKPVTARHRVFSEALHQLYCLQQHLATYTFMQVRAIKAQKRKEAGYKRKILALGSGANYPENVEDADV